MSDYEPTRTCPHRYCRSLHGLAAIAGMAFIAAAVSAKPYLLLIVLASALASAGIYRMIHKQTMTDSIREAVDGTVRIEVQPRWATAAVTMDAILTALVIGAFVYGCVTWQGDIIDGPTSRASLLGALASGLSVTAASEILHRKATRIQAEA